MKNQVKVKINTIDNAKEFVKICENFDEDIYYTVGRYSINAKSILGILSTTLGKIAEVKIYSTDLKTIELFFDSINTWIVEGNI